MSRPTVAIIGASADRSKFGNQSLHAHQQQGYEVFPVNPKGGTIEGLTVYPTIEAVPCDALDRVSLYVPPAVGLTLVAAIAAKGCRELWLNPGSESDALVAQARALGLEPIVACSIVHLGGSPNP
jgi:predicted CoA-binding protein